VNPDYSGRFLSSLRYLIGVLGPSGLKEDVNNAGESVKMNLMFRHFEIYLLCMLVALSFLALGMTLAPSRDIHTLPGEEYMFGKVDDFEDANFKRQPKWWTFDQANLSVEAEERGDSNYCLKVGGSTANWYVGGIGTYIGTDASRFTHLQLDVYGTGKGSGRMKIEIFEDDNGNQQIEQDPKKNFAPLFDDKWVYEMDIDWKGWKTVSILLSDFKDENPGVGDDVWNPSQKNGSGGLIQIQFIFTASKKEGAVNFKIDNVKFVKYIENK
jgi:hypothetical protein